LPQVRTSEFKSRSRQALGDAQIQVALRRVMGHFDEAREAAIQEFSPARWQELRLRASAIKAHTIAHLDYYLEELERHVVAAGGVVHFARTAQEANGIVAELARARKVQLVAKGKSMVSEELGLNQALEGVGVEVVETDLGEYILQLADEAPFHIIAPAMHKSKEQVAELFSQRLGTPRYDDIQQLCEAAREVLRAKFAQADMGITGVNFAVAESGTMVLVTNEGNGRMCTSLPRIHVALMGMEKVVPRLEDLGAFLPLLTRAATGQRITSYVTFITGPRRAEDEDGPEEFHLVVVDNGRSRLLEDEQLREALNCIRCGACLNVCPVYRKVGGHAYGWVYPGPIGAVVTPMLVGLPQAKDLPFASSLCGACHVVCPVNINIPRLLLRLRQRVTEGAVERKERKGAWWEPLLVRAWAQVLKGERTLAVASGIGRLLQRPFLRRGWLRWLPPPFSGWTSSRDFPSLAERTFRKRWGRARRKADDDGH